MNNVTEIIFIIDKSGSMQPLIDDTIGGFNGFVESQKGLDGVARMTTVLFSSDVQKLYDRVDIREVPKMDKAQYVVGGMTAMLDAIGGTIDEVQSRIDKTPMHERPQNVICVITTDGAENASTKYNKKTVQKMIEHQTEGHGWKFIFLGANMDAVAEAASYGINYAATYTADAVGTKSVYTAVDCAVNTLRATGDVTVTDWAYAATSNGLDCEAKLCDVSGQVTTAVTSADKLDYSEVSRDINDFLGDVYYKTTV